MIKYVASTIVGLESIGTVKAVTPDSIKEYRNQKGGQATMVTNQAHSADMFLTLPGFSISTLLMNIQQLGRNNPSPTPIIIDRYDWERLRGMIVTKTDDNHAQRLGLMYHQLYQQGMVKIIDYQKYYPQDIQTENIEQTRELVSAISDHENRNAARQAADGFISFALGSYQESLRKTLDNLDRYVDRRGWVQNEKDKIERGTGDPELWNERVLNQYLAGLEVRRNLEREMNCDIKCIGQQESGAIMRLLDSRNGCELPHSLEHSTESFSNLVHEFDVEDTVKRREIADKISDIAQEVVGIDNDHWFVFGPRLALLESGDTYTRARSQIRFGSIDSIVSEAKELHRQLVASREVNRSVEFLTAEAEWLMEQNDLYAADKQRLLDQLRSEVTLTNFSRELDDLSQGYSPVAKTVVESIVMDPLHRYTRDDMYQEAVDMMRMLEPVSLSDDQLETFFHRGAYRRGSDNYDWYQDSAERLPQYQ